MDNDYSYCFSSVTPVSPVKLMHQKIGGLKQMRNLQYGRTTAIWGIERVSRVCSSLDDKCVTERDRDWLLLGVHAQESQDVYNGYVRSSAGSEQ